MAQEVEGGSTQATVTVLGEAAIRVEPDEAIVWITLSKIDTLPGSAVADVAGRIEVLSGMLAELSIPRADRSTAGVSVVEEFDHTKQGRRSLGYRAQASISVRLADGDAIGRLIMRATEGLEARISGPAWRISAGNPAWLEAATQAAASAKAKAAAYAEGVDARLGALVALSEPEHGRRAVPLAARAASGSDMHVEAGEQEVMAAINATFALEHA